MILPVGEGNSVVLTDVGAAAPPRSLHVQIAAFLSGFVMLGQQAPMRCRAGPSLGKMRNTRSRKSVSLRLASAMFGPETRAACATSAGTLTAACHIDCASDAPDNTASLRPEGACQLLASIRCDCRKRRKVTYPLFSNRSVIESCRTKLP